MKEHQYIRRKTQENNVSKLDQEVTTRPLQNRANRIMSEKNNNNYKNNAGNYIHA